MIVTLTQLEEQALFQGELCHELSASTRAAMLGRGRAMRFGQRSGCPSRTVLLPGALCAVATGAVKLGRRLASGRELAISFVEPGAWFGGCSGHGPGKPYQIHARGPVVLLVLDEADVAALCRDHADFVRFLMSQRARFERRLCDLLEELHDMSLPLRLHRQLKGLSRRFGVRSLGGTRIDLRLSQTDLGDLTGVCRQRMNVQLKALEREGLLRVRHGYVELQPAFDALDS